MDTVYVGIVCDGGSDFTVLSCIATRLLGCFGIPVDALHLRPISFRNSVDTYWKSGYVEFPHQAAEALERALMSALVTAVSRMELALDRAIERKDVLILHVDSERYFKSDQEYFNPRYWMLPMVMQRAIDKVRNQLLKQYRSCDNFPTIVHFIPFPSTEILIHQEPRDKSALQLKQDLFRTQDMREVDAAVITERTSSMIDDKDIFRNVYRNIPEARLLFDVLTPPLRSGL